MGEEMLTLKQLRKWHACEEGIEAFRDPGGCQSAPFSERPMREVVRWLHEHRNECAPGPRETRTTYGGWLRWLGCKIGVDVDKYLKPEQKAEVFEPEELQVGDKIHIDENTVVRGAEAAWVPRKHYEVLVVAKNAPSSSPRQFCLRTFPGRMGGYGISTVEKLRTHITKVERDGVQIFPKSGPKLKKGDWVEHEEYGLGRVQDAERGLIHFLNHGAVYTDRYTLKPYKPPRMPILDTLAGPNYMWEQICARFILIPKPEKADC